MSSVNEEHVFVNYKGADWSRFLQIQAQTSGDETR